MGSQNGCNATIHDKIMQCAKLLSLELLITIYFAPFTINSYYGISQRTLDFFKNTEKILACAANRYFIAFGWINYFVGRVCIGSIYLFPILKYLWHRLF